MSRFMGKAAAGIAPYVPGEQPKDRSFVKLNTNECPYPPTPAVAAVLREFDPETLRLYSDTEAASLRAGMAASVGLSPGCVFVGGGSDEVLGYSFMAFFDRGDRVYFPDITYGFYKVYADLFGLDARELPLREDFTVAIEDYCGLDGHMYIANPNAPTGICLTPPEIEKILKANPQRLVVIDEAYADFAPGMSCIPLIDKYDNLLVVQTFSKSKALAGMRIGFGFGRPELMAALERMKYSFNPYNMDHISMLVGMAAISDGAYTKEIVGRVMATRQRVAEKLTDMGFTVLPSSTNFLFVRLPAMGGAAFMAAMRERGYLVRHFDKPRIRDFLRVTIGSEGEMDGFLAAAQEICREGKQ